MSVSSKLDYKPREYSYPKYKFHRLNQQNGRSDVILNTTGGSESVFEIPAKVFNLSKSCIRATLYKNNDNMVSSNFNIYNSQASVVSEIQFYNSSGVMVCDLKFANNYTDVVSKPETKLTDYLSSSFSADAESNFLSRSNSSKSTINSSRYDASLSDISYTEHQYFKVIPGIPTIPEYKDGKGNTIPEVPTHGDELVFNFNLPLKIFKNTIFSLDKDLYYGETMFIRIVWASTLKIGWITDYEEKIEVKDGKNVSVINYNPTIGTRPIPGDISIKNLFSYIAIENDPLILNAIMSKYSVGMNYVIPYVHSYKTNQSGSNQSTFVKLMTGHGRRLKKVYHAFYNPNESKNTAYEHDNLSGKKCSKYYTTINGEKRQEFDIVPIRYDDYLLHNDRFVGSLLQSKNLYLYNYFILDDFTEDTNLEMSKNEEVLNYDSGYPINNDLKWDIYCDIPDVRVVENNIERFEAQSLNHYSFAVVSRDIYVGPSGLKLQ